MAFNPIFQHLSADSREPTRLELEAPKQWLQREPMDPRGEGCLRSIWRGSSCRFIEFNVINCTIGITIEYEVDRRGTRTTQTADTTLPDHLS